MIRHRWVGHNRRRIGVDQNCFDSIFPQRTKGLTSRIIEFTCLTYDDGAWTYYENRVYFRTLWHELWGVLILVEIYIKKGVTTNRNTFVFQRFIHLFFMSWFRGYRQLFSAFCTTCGQYFLSTNRRHSFHEAMLVAALSFRGLKCSFHNLLCISYSNGCKYTI